MSGTVAGAQRIYRNDSEIPRKYFDTFKKLEDMPLGQRIMEIDTLYWEHARKNNIQVGHLMTDVDDRDLLELVGYREKCMLRLTPEQVAKMVFQGAKLT